MATRSTRCCSRALSVTAALVATLCLAAAPAFSAPAITLSRAAGPPTSGLSVSGTGFGANEIVDVFFDQQALVRTVTNGSGAFGATRTTVPSEARPGQHWVIGRGERTQTAAIKSFIVRTDWQQEGRLGSNTGYNPFENQLDPLLVRDLDHAWSASTGGPAGFAPPESPSPAVADGSVYVGSSAAPELYAFDAETGARKFVIRTSANVLGTPAVVGRQVIVALDSGQVRAYSTTTRALLWWANVGPSSSPGVAAHGDRLYAATDGRIFAFRAACRTDGGRCSPIWSGSFTSAHPSSNGPAVDGRNVVVSSGGGVTGFDADCGTGGATCSALWTGENEGSFAVRSPPALAGGYAYIGDESGRLVAFPVRCGGIPGSCGPAWRSADGFPVSSSPVIARGFVYLASNTGPLRAFDAATCAETVDECTPTWLGTGPRDHYSVAATRGTIFAFTPQGRVVAYPASCNTGGGACAPIARVALPGGLRSRPVVVDGRVYANSYDGNLYMLDRSGVSAAATTADAPDPATLETDESVAVRR